MPILKLFGVNIYCFVGVYMQKLQKTRIIAAAMLVASSVSAEKTKTEFVRYTPGQTIILDDKEQLGSTGVFNHKLNPEATVPFDFQTGSRIVSSKTNKAFLEFIEKRKGTFTPQLLSFGFDLTYSRFFFKDLVRYQGTTDEQEGVGAGNTIGLSPSLVVAGGLGDLPFELEAYLNLQYMKYDMTVTSATERESIGARGIYTGPSGFELRFPSLLTSNPAFLRFERFGMGTLAVFPNQFVYCTLSMNYSGSENHLIRTTISPFHNSFAGDSEPGLEAQLLHIQHVTDWGVVSTSPGLRTEYNTNSKTARLEAFNEINLELQGRYRINLRGGWSGIVAGDDRPEAPATPFGSLNFTVITNK